MDEEVVLEVVIGFGSSGLMGAVAVVDESGGRVVDGGAVVAVDGL